MPTAPLASPDFEAARRWVRAFFESEEGEAYVDACSSMQTARGLCAEVSLAFADYLRYNVFCLMDASGARDEEDRSRVRGEARVLDLDAHEHEYIPCGSAHSVAVVGLADWTQPLVVDLTHRQFDEGADLPLIRESGEFLREWSIYDEG